MNRRKNPRLKAYDYSQRGGYFITFCTKDRAPLLSTVVVGGGVLDAPQTVLTAAGEVVDRYIRDLGRYYPWMTVEHSVIMPNHVHLLLLVHQGPPGTSAPTNMAIPRVISALKRFTNRDCGTQLWQRGYYDHILRDEADFLLHWDYIASNPGKWAEDEYHL